VKTNKAWHEQHRMPKNSSLAQRISWHLEQAQNCACPNIPDKLKLEMKKRKRSIN
jgi:hypothetical protein